MDREQELRAQLSKIYAELHQIEDARRTEAARALIGKCFKFHNSYGTTDDNGEIEHWWLHAIVVDEHTMLKFQIDKSGRVKIDQIDFMPLLNGLLGEHYVEIQRQEFDAAWQEMIEKLQSIIAVVRL